MIEQDLKTELIMLANWASNNVDDDVSRQTIDRIEKRLREHLNMTLAWPEQKQDMAAKLRVLEKQVSELAAELE